MKKYIVGLFVLGILSCARSQDEGTLKVCPGAFSTNSYVPLLIGKTVGVVANKSTNITGVNLVDSLLAISANNNNAFIIKKVFTPEHGFSGAFDAGATIDSEKHGYPLLEIISLYGKKKKPDTNDLKGIDVVIFDLQDVGTRFYTYISTLHYVMQACAENDVPLIVLDRPNPNAFYIDGPVLEDKYISFVGLHPVPVVYGMTIGEYAQMINGEGWLGSAPKCELTVIPMQNYSHHTVYVLPDKPSPNLPNMNSVYLYPSLCFFEGTVVSVGRGTEFPFQVYGHPDYPYKQFSFIPKRIEGASLNPVYENKTCYGADLRLPHDSLFNLKGQLELKYLLEMYNSLGSKEDFFNNYFDYLAGTDKLRKQILAGKTENEIREGWQAGLEKFKKIRAKYLLYPD
ncbi:MAG: DUF1343 domain-containing protein [Bacteroidales bacterium]|nr:DUF1343 domain-containing protein [Bacteroidales bacterium]